MVALQRECSVRTCTPDTEHIFKWHLFAHLTCLLCKRTDSNWIQLICYLYCIFIHPGRRASEREKCNCCHTVCSHFLAFMHEPGATLPRITCYTVRWLADPHTMTRMANISNWLSWAILSSGLYSAILICVSMLFLFPCAHRLSIRWRMTYSNCMGLMSWLRYLQCSDYLFLCSASVYRYVARPYVWDFLWVIDKRLGQN